MEYAKSTIGITSHAILPTATYNDIMYIVDKKTKEEVTSYARPLKLEPVPLSSTMPLQHEIAQLAIHANLDLWTSHTVMVVDTSER